MSTAAATTSGASASPAVILAKGRRGKHNSRRGAFFSSPTGARGATSGRRRGGSVAARAELQQWDAETAECMLMEGGSMVLSFGTTWCGPCTLLAPELSTAAKAMEDYDAITVAKVCGELYDA